MFWFFYFYFDNCLYHGAQNTNEADEIDLNIPDSSRDPIWIEMGR